jgi:hypothetical protein
MVGFAYRAPITVAPVQRHRMIIVTHAFKVKQKRLFPLEPQRHSRKHRPFQAMHLADSKRPSRRKIRLSPLFMIHRNPVQKILDFYRRGKFFEDPQFRFGQTKHIYNSQKQHLWVSKLTMFHCDIGDCFTIITVVTIWIRFWNFTII